jgi:VWFA-related protein
MLRDRKWAAFAAVMCLAGSLLWAQQAQQQPKDSIPDAPSATRPPQPLPNAPLPDAPPPNAPATKRAPSQDPTAPIPTEQNTPPVTGSATTNGAPGASGTPDGSIRDAKAGPPGRVPQPGANTRDELFTIIRNVNFVSVPVTVKDRNSGRLVDGLLPKDFSVFEDGVKQKLTYFTSDPFPISAAVIFDLGMPDEAVQKVNQTFPALEGAFSPFDQVALYTYSNVVTKLTDFTVATQKLSSILTLVKQENRGRNNGVPVTSGPMANQGPMVNGIPVTGGGSTASVSTPPRESRVLNDALLRAALDLSKQERTRRRVIFVISDGRELRSNASYADTLKVLLTNGISVYGIATDSSALPVYKQLSKLHLPRQGYDNLLPKYAYGTGGEVFSELSQQAIERAYASAAGEARNQYTLGYQAKPAQASTYRDIEVKVDIPNLEVRAKAGYYPLPPGR